MSAQFIEQRSPEWFAQRAQLVTASEAAYALGISKYKTVDEYVHDKVLAMSGAEPTFKGNKFTVWGTEKEATAKLALENEIDSLIVEAELTVHSDHHWLGASPDGIVDRSTGVEIKCPYDDAFSKLDYGPALLEKCKDKLYTIAEKPDYWIQTQIQMACCGFDRVIFFVWTPMKTHQEIVERDDKWLAENLPKLKAVHDRIVAEYNDPEQREKHLSNTAHYTQDDVALQLSEEYAQIKRQQDDLDQQLKVVKDKLISRINGDAIVTPFLKATLGKPRRTLNQKALFAECEQKGIDPEKYYTEGAQAWRITLTES
jgi:putative phage-type endonuclease